MTRRKRPGIPVSMGLLNSLPRSHMAMARCACGAAIPAAIIGTRCAPCSLGMRRSPPTAAPIDRTALREQISVAHALLDCLEFAEEKLEADPSAEQRQATRGAMADFAKVAIGLGDEMKRWWL